MRPDNLYRGGGARGLAGAAAVLLSLLLIAPAVAQSDAPSVVIVNPRNEETVHDNTGKVPVSIAVRDGGALPEGSSIHVLLDGRPYGTYHSDASFVLEGIERGSHTLQAQLVNAGGKIMSSDAVTFHMWQASRLFPGRK